MAAYAKRMAAQINEPNPVLMGLSFGGIMCIEIAKQIAVDKVILISSIPFSPANAAMDESSRQTETEQDCSPGCPHEIAATGAGFFYWGKGR